MQAVQPRLGREALWLVGVGGGWSLALAVSSPFVGAYLWQQQGDLSGVGLWKVFQYALMAVGFVAAGWMGRRRGAGAALRAAAVTLAAAYVLLGLPRHVPAALTIPVGCLMGLAFSYYWLAWYLLALDATRSDERDRLNGWLGVSTAATRLLAPPLAALFIATAGPQGYRGLFLLTAALLLAVWAVGRRFPAASGLPCAYRLRAALRGDPAWRSLLGAFLLLGMREGVTLFFPALLTFLVTGSPGWLGVFASFTAVVGGLSSYLAGRWRGDARWSRRGRMAVGAAIEAASVLWLIHRPDLGAILVFGGLDACGYTLLKVPLEAAALDVIGRQGDAVERTVIKEVALNLSRAVVAAVFLALALRLPDPLTLRWVLVGVAPATLGVAWLARRLQAPGEYRASGAEA